jgi:lipoprotein-anchoring transpeptidase ErfK/SrfK
VFGVVGVVLSRACRPAWYRVQLPVRPNGSRGFVRAADLDIGRLHTRIVVDLSARRLTFYRSGRRVLSARAAVGADRTPTPTGRFYVDQRLIAADPAGPWGPGAIGISAHSDALRSWAQGGPIAIHGTNAPWSLGRPVSNGCIRLDNRTLSRLFAETPAGTPVLIQA